jgi:1-acyl-sn-glycerol-3-phosphate acyltransferase
MRTRRLVSTVAVWAVLLLIGPPAYLLVALARRGETRWRVTAAVARLLCAAAGCHVDVEGTLDRADEPVVVVANHDSYVDAAVLILALATPVVFVAGAELADQRVAGPLLRRLGAQFVGGGAPESPGALLSRLEAVLATGHSLAIFPEGSLAMNPGLRRFRAGAFLVAARCGRPVVPVAILASRRIIPPGHRMISPGRVRVVIGAPLAPNGNDLAAVTALTTASRAAVAAALTRPGEEPETQAPGTIST